MQKDTRIKAQLVKSGYEHLIEMIEMEKPYFNVLLLSLEKRSTTSNQASGALDIGRPKQSWQS